MSQDWNELEALRASLRENMAEIKRLNECLTWEQHRAEHIGTHGPGCAEWGPRHYECLLRAHKALKERTEHSADIGKTSDQSEDALGMVEPVAWMTHGNNLLPLFHKNKQAALGWGENPRPLYTAPPKREPLTDAEIAIVAADIWGSMLIAPQSYRQFARAVERAHGIGGEE